MRLLVETMHCATSTLRHLNCADLAMIAADLGHAAAVRLGEPLWRGVADYVRLVTLPAESKAIARGVAPDSIDSDTRKAAYYIDYGRGLAQTRKHDAEALASFLRAERTAPQRTRRSSAARESVGTMVRRARADAGGRQLQELAARIGVA